MAPALYPLWKKALMDQGPTTNNDSGITDSATLGPYCALIDTGVYTYSAAHQFFSSALSAMVGTAQRITPTATTVSGTDGVFDGGDLTYTAVSGASVEALIIYRLNTGANTTWKLMSYYDTAGGGLPVTPNGGNITVTWNASGIFQLSDARAKHEIRRIGTVGPLGLYEYRYRRAAAPLEVGFIAQEVSKHFPNVVRRFRGLLHVNYAATLRLCHA
jgi:endosialidase-like protein